MVANLSGENFKKIPEVATEELREYVNVKVEKRRKDLVLVWNDWHHHSMFTLGCFRLHVNASYDLSSLLQFI